MQKTIYIQPYTKADGTEVKGHYRVINTEDFPSLGDEISNQTQAPWTPDDISFPSAGGNSDDGREENKDAGEYGPARMPEKGQASEDSSSSSSPDSKQDSEDDDNDKSGGGEILGVLLKTGQFILQILPEVLGILQNLQNMNTTGTKIDNLKLTDNISLMKNAQNQLTKLENDNYKKLAQIKDKSQYLKLLDETLKLKEYNDTTRSLLSRMEYYAKNENYEDFSTELKEYKKCSEEFFNEPKIKSLQIQANNNTNIKHPKFGNNNFVQKPVKPASATINRLPILKGDIVYTPKRRLNGAFEQNINYNEISFLPDMVYNYMRQEIEIYQKVIDWVIRYVLHFNPLMQLFLISLALKNMHKENAYILWVLALCIHDNDFVLRILGKNGELINTIFDLPKNLCNVVFNKIKTQLNKDDCKGIIFNSSSNIAQKIYESEELNNFIRSNIKDLKNNKRINGSFAFKQDKDLHLSLNNIDIIDAHIDTNGIFRAYILDTYDFNPNDPDWKVEWAHNVQKFKLITPYYIIIILEFPISNI